MIVVSKKSVRWTAIAALMLMLATFGVSLAGPQVSHGPTFPPDPWDGKVAHGPTFPPDPWDGKVAHGPTFPPDPWDGKSA
ncbi:MAG: hypothetical protein ABSH50_00570 [Bryobacteraceae bacterium]